MEEKITLEEILNGRIIFDEEEKAEVESILYNALGDGTISFGEEFDEILIRYGLGTAEEFVHRNGMQSLLDSL